MTRAAAALILALSVPSGVPAGGVSGDVRDADGGVIPGAMVVLSEPSLPRRTATTDAAGRFQFADLPAGRYELTVSLQGFRTFRRAFELADGQQVRTTIALQLGALTEVVNVVATRSGGAPAKPAPQAPPAKGRAGDAPAAVAEGLPPAVEPMTGPIRVGGSIQEPRKVRDQAPVYPQIAIAAHIVGVVIIEATVARDGTVTGLKVLKSAPLLDAAAQEAVKNWQYTPTLLNGRPVEIQLVATVNYTLR